jgi:hypothetical protein
MAVSRSTTGEKRVGRPPGRTNLKVPADRQTTKFTSNGVQTTVRAIQMDWNGGTSSLKKFTTDFSEIFDAVAEVYAGHAKSKGPRTPKGIQALVDRLAQGKQDISFHLQRAFAEYLDGIPVGLFMLYTQAVSDASHNESKQDIVNLLRATSGALTALEQWLEQGEPVGLLIDRAPDINAPYSEFKAKIDGLRVAVLAFNEARAEYRKRRPSIKTKLAIKKLGGLD